MEQEKNIFSQGDSHENEPSSKVSVERGKSFIKNRLETAGKSVLHFLKLDQPAQKDMLVISSALAAAGVAYLFIRQEAPGPAVDPLWESMQNFVSNELPKIFSSLKNAELPQWDLARNMGTADITMTVITSLFSIESIKEAARLIVNKMKKETAPA